MASALAIVCMLFGDVGWQPLPDGGTEYIIQITPELLELLQSGHAFRSDIPPHLQPVRAYRIVWGTEPLPREAPKPSLEQPAPEGSTAGAPKPSLEADTSLRSAASSKESTDNQPLPSTSDAEPPRQQFADADQIDRQKTAETSTPAGSAVNNNKPPIPGKSQQPTLPERSSSQDAFGSVHEKATDNTPEGPISELAPRPLPEPAVTRPLEAQWADFVQAEAEVQKEQPATAASEKQDDAGQSWWLLLALGLTSFVTTATAVYCGWLAADYRQKYRRLLQTTVENGTKTA